MGVLEHRLIALCIAWVAVDGQEAKAASQRPVLALLYELSYLYLTISMVFQEKAMNFSPIYIQHKFSSFDELWSPKVIAEMNDYQFKLVKLEREFVWHDHMDSDEIFIVIDGEMEIEFWDGKVSLGPGELFVVPKGKEHKPVAKAECRFMPIESRGVINTGETGGELTAGNDVCI